MIKDEREKEEKNKMDGTMEETDTKLTELGIIHERISWRTEMRRPRDGRTEGTHGQRHGDHKEDWVGFELDWRFEKRTWTKKLNWTTAIKLINFERSFVGKIVAQKYTLSCKCFSLESEYHLKIGCLAVWPDVEHKSSPIFFQKWPKM